MYWLNLLWHVTNKLKMGLVLLTNNNTCVMGIASKYPFLKNSPVLHYFQKIKQTNIMPIGI